MIDYNYIDKILSDSSEENKKNIIGLTNYICTYPLNNDNYYLFQKLIDKNIKEVLEILFKNRTPETFFSILKPTKDLIQNALSTLIKYSPKILNIMAITSCLGILENNYKKSKDGLKIYLLTSSDIQHIGKYLLLDEIKIIKIITEILESIWNANQKGISVLSKNIINSYYDNNKNLTDFIPENLLI